MRYSAEHKASTRQRIVDGAAAALRARGLSGVGVAELMQRAGLTHGGFYAHFPSKDALISAAIDAASDQSVKALRKVVKRAGPRPALPAIVDAYLSAAHRDRPDRGCALASLGAEGARESPAARRALALQVDGLLGLLAEHVPDRPGVARRSQAIAVLSGLVGALILSRVADDRDVSDEILAAARQHLTAAAGGRLTQSTGARRTEQGAGRVSRRADTNPPLARRRRHQAARSDLTRPGRTGHSQTADRDIAQPAG